MEKTVSSHKNKRKNERLAEEARKKKMRLGMLIAGAIIALALIILAIIQANQPKKGFPFDYASQPTIGQADAPIKMVEFGDFKCPICKDFATKVYPQLKKDFIDTGKVQLSFINFSFIPGSTSAAIAVESVYHQNKAAFWPYYEAIYKNQQNEKLDWATSDFLTTLAKTENIPVDYDLLKKDIDDKVYEKTVIADNSIASKSKTNATPTLFINGFPISTEETMDYAKLKAAIEKEHQ
ncbi:MAG: thioredoxin domain-containing protein [Paenibacillaceae bacterium]